MKASGRVACPVCGDEKARRGIKAHLRNTHKMSTDESNDVGSAALSGSAAPAAKPAKAKPASAPAPAKEEGKPKASSFRGTGSIIDRFDAWLLGQ